MPYAQTSDGAVVNAADISIGVLGYQAPVTMEHTLKSHLTAGLQAAAGEYFVFHNAMTDADRDRARRFGVPCHGNQQNIGIYNGFRAIVELAKHPYVLLLENDCVALGAPAEARRCLDECVADMAQNGCPVFCLTARRQPGQGNVGLAKYVRCFGVQDPLTAAFAARRAGVGDQLFMLLKHGGLDRFRGHCVYVEKSPQTVQPKAIRRLPSGSFLTSSRYRNWGNRAVLVQRSFFLDVVCRRIDAHPDRRTANGHQQVEQALNRNWWRRLEVPMGSARDGIFTHQRLSR